MLIRVVLATLTFATVAQAAPHEISVFESRDRTATTEGDVIIRSDPATAYAIVTDYANWSRIFPDLRRAVVTKRMREAVEVTLVRRDGNVDHLRFRNEPAARIVAFEQIGGDAEVTAEIVFSPGDVAGTTRVHSRLHAEVNGLASAFVSDSDVRARRQQQLRESLGRLQDYFAGNGSSH